MNVYTLDGTILVNTRNVLTARQHRDTVQIRFAGDPEDTPFALPSVEAAKNTFSRLVEAIENAEDHAGDDLSTALVQITDTLAGIKSAIELRDA